MSHITKLKINISSKEHLIKGLKAMGYTAVEGKALETYSGSKSSEKVDITLEEQPSISFRKVSDGSYEFVGDFYGTGKRQGEFMEQLGTEYNLSMYTDLAKKRGKRIVGQTRVGNEVMLRVAI